MTLFYLTEQMAKIETILEESGGELTPELESEWNETSQSLAIKADNYNALIRHWEGASDVIKKEIDRLSALKKTLDNSVKRTQEHIKDVMLGNDMQRIDGNFCKMYITKTTATEVDETTALAPYEGAIAEANAKLPDWITLEPKISKKVVATMFKNNEDGLAPAGISFKENYSLTIK